MFIPVADVQDLDAVKREFASEWKYVDKTEFEGFGSAGSPAGTACVTGVYYIFTKRVMYTMTMFLGKEMKDEFGALQEPDAQGVILGQLMERPKEQLLDYLGAAETGTLQVFIEGKRYKVVQVRSDGSFRAEPDFHV